ncbi:MAG: rhomboid family intramembrane serine protease [Fuerstiella sp.]|nr:rhomboid family intramembrane serine protease [Fuerstiella sp.]MCP4783520.1 rhomboid family intramembrane serine protease [Fuerstiella sp.]MCP4854446.1 rhomboid family intramembrane serine protease [Fuerstiella sp.]
MRELTTLSSETHARRLSAFLATKAIEAGFDEENGEWIIWVHNDDDRTSAEQILSEFQSDPNHERYEAAERKVKHVFREADRLQKQANKQQNRLKKRWGGSWWHCYPATYILIGLCVLVSLVCTDWKNVKMGPLGPQLCNKRDSGLLLKLGVQTPVEFEQNGVRVLGYPVIPELPWENLDFNVLMGGLVAKAQATTVALGITMSSGQLWRPITPIFVHYGLLHILFNMMWLRGMGMGIEFVRGTPRFVALCLILAATSNIAQLFWSGPYFGGMSGVVFGLIGYVWMKGKTQPELGIELPQQTVVFCLLWLFMCMTGALGPIANAAHLVGFVVGILVGARQAIWKKLPFAG